MAVYCKPGKAILLIKKRIKKKDNKELGGVKMNITKEEFSKFLETMKLQYNA